ncbi:hypothetical protein HN51_015777 [Arachis hypogaea]|uniref:Uncharacterized protein n=1 Tax=Arachis hypogaea TaxID=3818 RepID=A0A445CIZ8_ARAHY|nr:uncharacterized protein LOC112696496 [Arachis hypogaea]QHO46271.1 uncharacterized protein DS421_6g185940 [Arachis hypogaea]RYR50894.1 hypothetical protein Ahy_A06g025903 [Arachis hypogaea]
MKITAKVISSPGRTDKFPPPLMRFLRSNAGSRSRGRSRSSPMFVRKKNTAIETQEPSSPKVTCMGQVRVRRSAAAKRGRSSSASASASAARDGAPPTRCRCWWIRKNALFCRLKPNISNKKNKKKKKKNECRCQPVWPKWGFFRVGSFRRKPSTKLKEDCAKSESNFQRSSYDESEAEHEEDDESEIYEERVNPEAGFGSSNTPPKNALLLTRCRSAPYRSSSLACRFWSSPLRNSEEEEEEEEKERHETNEASSQRDSVSEEEAKRVSERDAKLGFLKEVESSNSNAKSEKVVEDSKSESETRPIILTRCKSEPARTGYKLDPEVNSSFWKKKTRLGLADIHIITD